MNSLAKLPLEFPFPDHIKTVVCCDLDETYIPFESKNKPKGGVELLEEFLCSEGSHKGMLLGWITGTNRESALRKAHNYIKISPNFICCSLGTEFYWVKGGVLTPSDSWKKRIIQSGYEESKIFNIVKLAKDNGIDLVTQPDDYQGDFKKSFYYTINESMDADFAWLKEAAKQASSRVVFTRCNQIGRAHV